jgi:hypothetical protein
MDINRGYKLSLLLNTIVSIFFILLMIAVGFNMVDFNTAALVITVIIIAAFIINLAFNRMLYSLVKANKETRLMPDWVINYRNFILILKIIAIILITLVFFTAAFTFKTDIGGLAKTQRMVYVVFLSLFALTLFTDVINIIYYQKLKKMNKTAVHSIIESIGEQDQNS